MIKAVIMDFDGVITDSEMLHLEAFNLALARFGVHISTQQYMDRYLGLTDRECVAALISDGMLRLDASGIDQLVAQKKHIYADLAAAQSRPIDGVVPFLEMVRANQIQLAICSGALRQEIDAFLHRAGLVAYFDVIVSAEDVTKGKPDPQGFVLALDRLSAKVGSLMPQECVVVEDSHWGLAAARAAGMHTIAVTNTYPPQQLAQAELIVARLDQLGIQDLRRLASGAEH